MSFKGIGTSSSSNTAFILHKVFKKINTFIVFADTQIFKEFKKAFYSKITIAFLSTTLKKIVKFTRRIAP